MALTAFEQVTLFDGVAVLVAQSVVLDGPTIASVGRDIKIPAGPRV